jgi:hypothetical protein
VGGTRETPIQHLTVSAYTVLTDMPESDGTYAWDNTTLVHGALRPDLSHPGLGLAFRHADAARYAV